MMFYFYIAFLFFIAGLYYSSCECRLNIGTILLGKVSFFALILFSIILGGIRWERGTDWPPYYNYFIAHTTWKQYNNGTFEILYTLLNFIIKQFTNSYTIFLCIFSILVITLKYDTIKKIAIYPALSYYLYFCANIGDIFPVRQTIAISIALASIYFIHKKNKWAFFFITLIAVGFHNSMLIWFLSYPIYHKRINNSSFIMLFIIAMICGIIGRRLYAPIIEGLLVKSGISGPIAMRIVGYTLGNYSDGSFNIYRATLSVIKRMIFIPLFLFLRPRLMKTGYKYIYGLLNLYIMGNIIYMLFAFDESFTPLIRMTTPFLFVETLVLPVFLVVFKKAYSKYMMLYVILFYGAWKLNTAVQSFPHLYIPYSSIFG